MTNFLRVIHLAFEKLSEGEAADHILIIFIMSDSEDDVRLHCGKELASRLRWPHDDCQKYQYEYLFEWHIPESNVVHEVTMATLVRRGFNLDHMCGQAAFSRFPEMKIFQELRREHWKGTCLFDQGYTSGAAACRFGFNSLTGRLAEEFLALIFCRRHSGCDSIQRGIEDALYSYASLIGDGLVDFEAELSDLSEAEAMLDDAYITEVGEIICDCSDEKLQEYPSPGQIVLYCRTIKQCRRLGQLLSCPMYFR